MFRILTLFVFTLIPFQSNAAVTLTYFRTTPSGGLEFYTPEHQVESQPGKLLFLTEFTVAQGPGRQNQEHQLQQWFGSDSAKIALARYAIWGDRKDVPSWLLTTTASPSLLRIGRSQAGIYRNADELAFGGYLPAYLSPEAGLVFFVHPSASGVSAVAVVHRDYDSKAHSAANLEAYFKDHRNQREVMESLEAPFFPIANLCAFGKHLTEEVCLASKSGFDLLVKNDARTSASAAGGVLLLWLSDHLSWNNMLARWKAYGSGLLEGTLGRMNQAIDRRDPSMFIEGASQTAFVIYTSQITPPNLPRPPISFEPTIGGIGCVSVIGNEMALVPTTGISLQGAGSAIATKAASGAVSLGVVAPLYLYRQGEGGSAAKQPISVAKKVRSESTSTGTDVYFSDGSRLSLPKGIPYAESIFIGKTRVVEYFKFKEGTLVVYEGGEVVFYEYGLPLEFSEASVMNKAKAEKLLGQIEAAAKPPVPPVESIPTEAAVMERIKIDEGVDLRFTDGSTLRTFNGLPPSENHFYLPPKKSKIFRYGYSEENTLVQYSDGSYVLYKEHRLPLRELKDVDVRKISDADAMELTKFSKPAEVSFAEGERGNLSFNVYSDGTTIGDVYSEGRWVRQTFSTKRGPIAIDWLKDGSTVVKFKDGKSSVYGQTLSRQTVLGKGLNKASGDIIKGEVETMITGTDVVPENFASTSYPIIPKGRKVVDVDYPVSHRTHALLDDGSVVEFDQFFHPSALGLK